MRWYKFISKSNRKMALKSIDLWQSDRKKISRLLVYEPQQNIRNIHWLNVTSAQPVHCSQINKCLQLSNLRKGRTRSAFFSQIFILTKLWSVSRRYTHKGRHFTYIQMSCGNDCHCSLLHFLNINLKYQYIGWAKKAGPYFCQILTDLKNFSLEYSLVNLQLKRY